MILKNGQKKKTWTQLLRLRLSRYLQKPMHRIRVKAHAATNDVSV